MTLQPHGASADAFDKFLPRYRILTLQAGAGVGAFARLEVLRRGADRRPKQGIVWAARKQSDGGEAGNLPRRFDETLAEGLRAASGQGTSSAWGAFGMLPAEGVAHGDAWAEATQSAGATAAAVAERAAAAVEEKR